ncbi:hypothetical protein Acr_08g0013130 [Actinidia rufa]|uniref:Uncharacterized protein n=1 Tax=Actinidia rufa TaxID=165716 RepID=A0A7J0F4Q8_9ERIC|nr:hypothetical protein Acr_08g0013130 [Actinidia rufa]
MPKPLLISESSGVFALPSFSSPWSDSHAEGVLSGLTPTRNICSSAQVARAIVEATVSLKSPNYRSGPVNQKPMTSITKHALQCSCLLPRPCVSRPLYNRAHTMTCNNQAPDFEGLHRKMHGIAEQIRIINENNAHLIQHLATNNMPPLAALVLEDVDRSCHSRRSGIHEKEVQFHLSLGLLAELTMQRARGLGEEDGHLAGTTGRQGTEIDPPPKRLENWTQVTFVHLCRSLEPMPRSSTEVLSNSNCWLLASKLLQQHLSTNSALILCPDKLVSSTLPNFMLNGS